MLAKFENVYVKISKVCSYNEIQTDGKAFRKLEIFSSDKLTPPLSLFIDEADFKNLPKDLYFTDDTEFDYPCNVIVNIHEINVGYDRLLFINLCRIEKI